MTRSTLSASYYAPKLNPQYEAECDRAEFEGFTDGINGKQPAKRKYFDFKKTCYMVGYRKGKAAHNPEAPF